MAEISKGFTEVSVFGDQMAMTELDARCFEILIKAADNQFAARSLTSVKGLPRRFWVLHQERYGNRSDGKRARTGRFSC